LQVHICKFGDLQVCKFTKLKNLENCKLVIKILHFINCKCVFASLQVYKIKKSRNYKLIITNLQLNKLQERICKFVQVYKFANIQSYKLHVLVCKFQIFRFKKRIASTCLQIYKITKLP
jgi:hypothetical protein